MCLAIPARIVALNGTDAVVDVDGVRRTANVAFIDGPQVGDFVIVHAGFALQKWSAQDVAEWRRIVGSAAPSGAG